MTVGEREYRKRACVERDQGGWGGVRERERPRGGGRRKREGKRSERERE